MPSLKAPRTPETFAHRLKNLQLKRREQHERSRAESRRRSSLTAKQRWTILEKTDGRCHICGGKVDSDWQADHVLAHSTGGAHAVDNYFPAHTLCNNYRWDYGSEEFQWISEARRVGSK